MDEETLALLRRIEQVLSDHNADRLDHKECERCDWDFGEKHGGTLDAVRDAISKATGVQP